MCVRFNITGPPLGAPQSTLAQRDALERELEAQREEAEQLNGRVTQFHDNTSKLVRARCRACSSVEVK